MDRDGDARRAMALLLVALVGQETAAQCDEAAAAALPPGCEEEALRLLAGEGYPPHWVRYPEALQPWLDALGVLGRRGFGGARQTQLALGDACAFVGNMGAGCSADTVAAAARALAAVRPLRLGESPGLQALGLRLAQEAQLASARRGPRCAELCGGLAALLGATAPHGEALLAAAARAGARALRLTPARPDALRVMGALAAAEVAPFAARSLAAHCVSVLKDDLLPVAVRRDVAQALGAAAGPAVGAQLAQLAAANAARARFAHSGASAVGMCALAGALLLREPAIRRDWRSADEVLEMARAAQKSVAEDVRNNPQKYLGCGMSVSMLGLRPRQDSLASDDGDDVGEESELWSLLYTEFSRPLPERLYVKLTPHPQSAPPPPQNLGTVSELRAQLEQRRARRQQEQRQQQQQQEQPVMQIINALVFQKVHRTKLHDHILSHNKRGAPTP